MNSGRLDCTSSTPASIAASSPLRLGVKAAYLTPGARRMLPTTSRPSAIWGTHLGLTKDAASMVPHPASDNRSTKPTWSNQWIRTAMTESSSWVALLCEHDRIIYIISTL